MEGNGCLYHQALPSLTFSVVRVQKYLEGMSGRQVLGMSREALETAFGREEGFRNNPQTKQQSHSNFGGNILIHFGPFFN